MEETLKNNFLRIAKIPRKSGNEEEIANFFVNVAKENNHYYFKDENNNVLIKKKGNINSSPIALQAHFDMVCVKTKDSNHNFETEGIDVLIDKDKVVAKDTSLGADQGVGLTMMLTILEDNTLEHPDLEFIFTVEEETTFKGAVYFPYSKIKSKRLINLDNSKDNSIVIGATGDICNEYLFEDKLIKNNLPSYKITIEGLPGGNSGENINLSKNNAIMMMAKIFKNKEIFLKSINGGTQENDIATSCEAIINTKLNVEKIFKGTNAKITKQKNYYSFSKKATNDIITQILCLESGPKLTSASANLGIIDTVNNKVRIRYIFRSIEENELENINQNTKKLNNNFKVSNIYYDSIWKINYQSELLEKYKNLYYNKYSTYPKEEICHGGSECSAIKKRLNELDIISIGSNIENIHTTKEITYISSWLKIYDLLINFIRVL